MKQVAKMNLPGVSKKIERFISGYLAKSGAGGLVVGLSGGLDSAAALQLCTSAVGARNIFGLILPSRFTPESDIADAKRHADSLSVEYRVVDIDPLVESYMQLLPDASDKIKGNLIARVRMGILHYYAAVKSYLVVGTSDRSEWMIGYFTKYGDGGSDLMPLAGLYKTQVRELARYLKVPAGIIEKKSSPRLWRGQLAEEELGMDYETLDPVLQLLVDKKMKPPAAAKKLGVSLQQVQKVQSMIEKSAHKRSTPPIARL